MPKMADKATSTIKEDVCTKFYDGMKPFYIGTNASGIGLGAALLQTRSNTSCSKDEAPDNSKLRLMAFASKSLTSMEKLHKKRSTRHNIVCKKCHHYCFASKANIVTDHKPLVVIFKKDVARLSPRLQ